MKRILPRIDKSRKKWIISKFTDSDIDDLPSGAWITIYWHSANISGKVLRKYGNVFIMVSSGTTIPINLFISPVEPPRVVIEANDSNIMSEYRRPKNEFSLIKGALQKHSWRAPVSHGKWNR